MRVKPLFSLIVAFVVTVVFSAPAQACHCVHGSDALMSDIVAKQLKQDGAILVEVEAIANGKGRDAHMTTVQGSRRLVGQSGQDHHHPAQPA